MLEKSLAKLDTDYVDFYHFWAINQKVFEEKILGMGPVGGGRLAAPRKIPPQAAENLPQPEGKHTQEAPLLGAQFLSAQW